MRRVVLDASAYAAVIFGEPDSERVLTQLEGAEVFAPWLLRYELASVAAKKARRYPHLAVASLAALQAELDANRGIQWRDVQISDVVLVAEAAGLSTYDASYLWLAATLGADLVTLDRRLAAAAVVI